MRNSAYLAAVFILFNLAVPILGHAQKGPAKSQRILSARTVYFDDQTGADAVGKAAVAQLKKWGRFKIVEDKNQADLILLLSAEPYHGGDLLMASGNTGSIDANGKVLEDPVPNFNKLAPTRDAYLTVIDPKTGDTLWTDSHVWGGVLTGANSVGERLVKKLKKQVDK